jgi:hypothetical protein
MNNKKPSDSYGINAELSTSHVKVSWYLEILHTCCVKEQIPDDWKSAVIKIIFKIGRTSFDNYMPLRTSLKYFLSMMNLLSNVVLLPIKKKYTDMKCL